MENFDFNPSNFTTWREFEYNSIYGENGYQMMKYHEDQRRYREFIGPQTCFAIFDLEISTFGNYLKRLFLER